MNKSMPQKVQIPGWPYYLTIEGHVYRDGSDRPLKPVLRRDGYGVTLCYKNRKKTFRLNNLMRDLYFGGTQLPIKHLDGDKLNFSYWNLRPMPRNQIPGAERPHGWYAKSVIETRPDGTETIYESAAECARRLYISSCAVRNWCNGKCNPSINQNLYRWED